VRVIGNTRFGVVRVRLHDCSNFTSVGIYMYTTFYSLDCAVTGLIVLWIIRICLNWLPLEEIYMMIDDDEKIEILIYVHLNHISN